MREESGSVTPLQEFYSTPNGFNKPKVLRTAIDDTNFHDSIKER